MDYRIINSKDFDLGMNIGWYSHISEYNKATDMYKLYPNLFIGCYNDDCLIGICCYGWSDYVHRWNKFTMGLCIISMIPEYRNKGLGSILLKTWENQVKSKGSWLIVLGSAANMFYVKNGYQAIEYCSKIHKGQLPPNYKDHPDISYIRHSEDPLAVIYVKTGGTYNADILKGLCTKFNAQDFPTIFTKQL